MKKVILAGIRLRESETEFKEKMQETEALCTACGLETVCTMIQQSRTVDPNSGFRSGKAAELETLVKDTGAEMIVFYNSLPIKAAYYLSEKTGVDVIDRTSLILDIFSLRARSRQAKLQTEMARLQYDLPRLTGLDESSGHERGGSSYNRGAGEMRSRLIERQYARRIQELKKELKKIEKQKNQDERRRTRTMMRRAALIGYTNAGKSSLMNALLADTPAAGKEVYTEDMLFATLDTSVRMIAADSRRFLLYDTVGFVSDLPHTLVEAFQSTLDACKDADLLIHVIDASEPDWMKKAEITENTLKQIGADNIPVMRVYNKTDIGVDLLIPEENRISCRNMTGIDALRKTIAENLYPLEASSDVLIPYDQMSMLDAYRAVLLVEVLNETESGLVVRLKGPQRYIEAFRHMHIS